MRHGVLLIIALMLTTAGFCQWTADYTFTHNPTQITSSYYDFMIGSNNNISVLQRPSDGKYLLVYHAQTAATGQRQCYYATFDPATGDATSYPLNTSGNSAGYPAVALDPVSEIPFFAWHTNADTDASYETLICWERPPHDLGVLSIPQKVFDGPMIIEPPFSNNNEPIWPSLAIGASPVAGMRRIYVVGRNITSHSTLPVGNAAIAYADFDEQMLLTTDALVWTYTSIPQLNAWDNDLVNWRRPTYGVSVDAEGTVYLAGHHSAVDADHNDLAEPSLDIFKNTAYGSGAWEYISANDELYCQIDPQGDPNTDQWWLAIDNSNHFNLAMDDVGRLHLPCLMEVTVLEDDVTYTYPHMQYPRDYVYDPSDASVALQEVYPVAGTASDNIWFLPWDDNGDGVLNPSDDEGNVILTTYFPFAHWDESLHDGSMMFNYNQIRMTNANGHGMMATVWQASEQLYTIPEDPPAYANSICIAVSPDNGNHWSEPIELDSSLLPFDGIIPMWVYPSGNIEYTGMNADNRKVGKLGLMFYDDADWGAFVLSPPAGNNTGGRVMFTELEITFPNFGVGTEDEVDSTPAVTLINAYPNPFRSNLNINLSTSAKGKNTLSIYNLKGQKVTTLANTLLDKGQHSFVWDGCDSSARQVASGIYYVRMDNGSTTVLKKIMLIR